MLHESITTTECGYHLYEAIDRGEFSAVAELLSKKPEYLSVRLRTGLSTSPLVLAVRHENPDIFIELLKTYQTDITPFQKNAALSFAAQQGRTSIITILLKECNDDITLDFKKIALEWAAQKGHATILQILLENCGNNINFDFKGSLLIKTIENAHLDAFNLLLETDPLVSTWAARNHAFLVGVANQAAENMLEASPERSRCDYFIARLGQIATADQPTESAPSQRNITKIRSKEGKTDRRFLSILSGILKKALIASLQLSLKVASHPATMTGIIVAAGMFLGGAVSSLILKSTFAAIAGAYTFSKVREAFAKFVFHKLSVPDGASVITKNKDHQYALQHDYASKYQQYFELGKKIEHSWPEYVKSLVWLRTYVPTEKGRILQAGRHAAKIEAQQGKTKYTLHS
ncbi:MAG: hypothetical protein U1E78_11065 [Gammaproteobacteria bacterium]